MVNVQKLVGERIRNQRNRLSITQQQLAEEAGLSSAQIVSQIEKGEREVKAVELFNLARALKTDITQFLSTDLNESPALVFWRKAPTIDRKVVEAEFIQRCNQYALVEKLCETCSRSELPSEEVSFDEMNFKDVEKLADKIGKILDLGSRPASSLPGLLEDKYGVKIWYQDLGEEGSAASSKGPFGSAVLINSAETPWRRNFSFAHELFHLITWNSIRQDKDITENGEFVVHIEKLANAFASYLLLPTEDVVEVFKKHFKDGKVTFIELIEVAREFDVSTEALLYRILNLRFINKEQVEALLENDSLRELDRRARMGKWFSTPEIPERFVRLAFLAYMEGKLSRARLAEFLNTGLANLTNYLLEYGLDDQKNYQAAVLTT